MKIIKLTSGGEAKVDDGDFEHLSKYRWSQLTGTNTFYACTTITDKSGKRRSISMHRVIMAPSKWQCVDHIDFDGLNNQRYNLRLCTKGENNCNRKCRTGKTSKFLGVFKENNSTRFRAAITKDGKTHKLGSFIREEDAALAYNQAALKFHGSFANINVI